MAAQRTVVVGGTGFVRPLHEVRHGDVERGDRSVVALARLSRAGLPVRSGLVVVPVVRAGPEHSAGELRPATGEPSLGSAYAALGIEGSGGARVVVHPVLRSSEPLPSWNRHHRVAGVTAVREELLALWRAAGPDRALLVQVASPPPEHVGWAYEVGSPASGLVLAVETAPFVDGASRPPAPDVLHEVARLTRRACDELGERCDIGWVSVGSGVELVDLRIPEEDPVGTGAGPARP